MNKVKYIILCHDILTYARYRLKVINQKFNYYFDFY